MSFLKTLGKAANTNPVAVINVDETNILDSAGKPYYEATLKNPVKVRCSTDKDIQSFETDKVLIRAEVVESDDYDKLWLEVEPGKPEEGRYIKGWVVDFSKGQRFAIYQETTIASWAKDSRSARKIKTTTEINNSITAALDAIKERNKEK